jgi:hypothetical protein
MLRFVICAGLIVGLSIPALADAGPRTDCSQQPGSTEPATRPAPASADGTAPGNAGSTGWSGGTGGSHIGTTQAAGDNQPAVAQGVDLMGAARAPCKS